MGVCLYVLGLWQIGNLSTVSTTFLPVTAPTKWPLDEHFLFKIDEALPNWKINVVVGGGSASSILN